MGLNRLLKSIFGGEQVNAPIVEIATNEGRVRTVDSGDGIFAVPAGKQGSAENPFKVPTGVLLYLGLPNGSEADGTEPGGPNVKGNNPNTVRESGISYMPGTANGSRTTIQPLYWESWPEDTPRSVTVRCSLVIDPREYPNVDQSFIKRVRVWFVRESPPEEEPEQPVDPPEEPAEPPEVPSDGSVSLLWGSRGERYDPGKLPFWAKSGLLWEPPVVAVMAAVGNEAELLEALSDRGVSRIYLPAELELTEPLTISRPVQIEGPSRMRFRKSLLEAWGPRANTGESGNYSWREGLFRIIGIPTGSQRFELGAMPKRGDWAIQASLIAGEFYRLVLTDYNGSLGSELYAGEHELHHQLINKVLVDYPFKVIAQDGNWAILDRPIPLDVQDVWDPRIESVSQPVRDVHVRRVTLEMPSRVYDGHWQESGWNGFYLEHVVNCSLRGCTVIDGDNGFLLEGAMACLLQNPVLIATENRAHRNSTVGHHGFQLSLSRSCEISGFVIGAKWVHDITLQWLAHHNVAHRGVAEDLNLDHHTGAPFMNLYTDIHSGSGERLFMSSGSTGFHAGRENTFWNVAGNGSPEHAPLWPELKLVGTPVQVAPQGWYEPLVLEPQDLFEAQRKDLAVFVKSVDKKTIEISQDDLDKALANGDVKAQAAGFVFYTSHLTAAELIANYPSARDTTPDAPIEPEPPDEPTQPEPPPTQPEPDLVQRLEWLENVLRGVASRSDIWRVAVEKADEKRN